MGCIQITNLPLQQPRSNILRVLRLHSDNLLLQIKPDISHTQGHENMVNFNNTKYHFEFILNVKITINTFNFIMEV